MKLKMMLVAMLMFGSTGFAAAQAVKYYVLSKDGVVFSRTPEVLSVEEKQETNGNSTAKIELYINDLGKTRVVAEFNLDLLQRARCFDCNQDVYGISNPSNSLFNGLSIAFAGKFVPGGESGTVSIGQTVFHYRKIYAMP